MKAIRLLLVRHGNTFEAGQTPTQVGARTDLLLTQEGKHQALTFAHYLASKEIQSACIYAGVLKRQIETAHIIGDHLRLDKIRSREPALTEIDYGAWEGLTAEAIEKGWPHEYKAWAEQSAWPPIFGSRREDHQLKIQTWLHHLTTTYLSGETIIGVTSNGILRLIYFLYPTDGIEEIKVKTGHFCELWLHRDGIKIQTWNQDPHKLCYTARG